MSVRAARRDLLAIRHRAGGAGQAFADQGFLGRMDVEAVAHVQRHRQTGMGVAGHRGRLGGAQLGPAGLARRLGWRAERGQLGQSRISSGSSVRYSCAAPALDSP